MGILDRSEEAYEEGKLAGFEDGWSKGWERCCMVVEDRYREQFRALREQRELEVLRLKALLRKAMQCKGDMEAFNDRAR